MSDPGQLQRDLDYLGLLVSFPWHTQQLAALNAATDVVVILGGTRAGKSQNALGIVSRLVRREGPIYRRLRKPENRPLKIWIAPLTFEKYQSVWEPRLIGDVFKGIKYDYVTSPHHVFKWDDACAKGNSVWGKCLPGWETAVMADGSHRPIASLRPGDWVLGCTAAGVASPARVTGMETTGRKEVLRVTFTDGTTLHASTDHRVLWQYHAGGKRYGLRRGLATLHTVASKKWGSPSCLTARERQYAPTSPLRVPPYLLGALLGDGTIRTAGVRLTSVDQAVVDRCERDLDVMGYRWSPVHKIMYTAVEKVRRPGRRPRGRLIAAMGDLGLLDIKSDKKFVPEAYFRASHADRLELIAGLVDSDGDYRRFSSTSRQLAEDFMRLVRSVGGHATIREKWTTCTNSATRARCLSWLVDFNITGATVPIQLPRKRKPASTFPRDTAARRVESSVSIGFHECYDISIDHPDHLFLAGSAEVAVHNTSDQGYMSFESDEVDLVIFDEEPEDQKVYTAAVQRFATTNGVVVLAYTPLRGMTWTNSSLYVPTVKPANEVASRVWQLGTAISVIQMGMADNPAAVEGGGVERLRNDVSISEAERNTRLYGMYGFAEGLIWPECADLIPGGRSPYLLDSLPADRPYHWVLTTDPNKRHGGLLCAIDPDDNWIVVAEHYAENLPDTLHARAYLNILRSFGLVTPQGHVDPTVGVYADPGGAGAQAIINMGETGLFAQPVPKDAGSVSASIKSIRRRLWVDPGHLHPVTKVQGAPHLYFLRGLRSRWKAEGQDYHDSRLMWEMRQYRQKDGSPPDTPIKALDDVCDPLRYLALVRPTASTVPTTTVSEQRRHLDQLSRREQTEFDATIKRATEPSRTRIVETW